MTKRIVLLQALSSTPVDIARIVRLLDQQTLRWQAAADQWSAAAVLIHFAQVENAYRHRLQRIVQENKPYVPSIDPAVNEIPDDMTAADFIQQFENERIQTVTFLKELSPAAWQRPAIHESFGRVTVRTQVQNLVEHDIEHTNQLVSILQERKRVETQKLETRD